MNLFWTFPVHERLKYHFKEFILYFLLQGQPIECKQAENKMSEMFWVAFESNTTTEWSISIYYQQRFQTQLLTITKQLLLKPE